MTNSIHLGPFTRSVVQFVSSCAPIERHVLAGKPLTETEWNLIVNTMRILQAALDVWHRTHSTPSGKAPRPDH
ncbi:MAG: hypothetical protein QM706_12200 [Nitrospira sp.]